MPNCVVKKNSELRVVKTEGHHAPGCIGHLPSGIESGDYYSIKLNKNGEPFVCKKAKSQWMKEQIKRGNSE